jgi:hypothetical protein
MNDINISSNRYRTREVAQGSVRVRNKTWILNTTKSENPWKSSPRLSPWRQMLPKPSKKTQVSYGEKATVSPPRFSLEALASFLAPKKEIDNRNRRHARAYGTTVVNIQTKELACSKG